MSEETRKDVIAGHLGAVARVDTPVLERHLETCVADAFRLGRSEKAVIELAEIFSTART